MSGCSLATGGKECLVQGPQGVWKQGVWTDNASDQEQTEMIIRDDENRTVNDFSIIGEEEVNT